MFLLFYSHKIGISRPDGAVLPFYMETGLGTLYRANWDYVGARL